MKYKAEILITEVDGAESTVEASALNESMIEKAIDRVRETAEVQVLSRWTE